MATAVDVNDPVALADWFLAGLPSVSAECTITEADERRGEDRLARGGDEPEGWDF